MFILCNEQKNVKPICGILIMEVDISNLVNVHDIVLIIGEYNNMLQCTHAVSLSLNSKVICCHLLLQMLDLRWSVATYFYRCWT